nr:MAG TPA: hypothetical protein [Caudoviricetes sp.]
MPFRRDSREIRERNSKKMIKRVDKLTRCVKL